MDLDGDLKDRIATLKTERDIAQASLNRIASQLTAKTHITAERIENLRQPYPR